MRYFFKRLISAVPLLFGITFLSFCLMHLAPGDPTSMYQDPTIAVADLEQIRENLGLDKPIVVQYFYWLKAVFQGDLGYSYVSGKPVLLAISERLPATLLLSLPAFLLIILITFPLGLISGYKKGTLFDQAVTFFSFLGLSIPTFWLGLMFILYFSIKLSWLPTSGFMDPSMEAYSFFYQANNVLKHMLLPLLTILIGGMASLTRYHRFGIINILSKPYIEAARARGLSEKIILYKHAFKNACLPIITILGLQLPGLISGSFVIEFIFAWPGMGKLGVDSVFSRDYPVLMGTLLFSSILIIMGTLLSDLAYSYVDPRIKKKT